MFKHKEMSEQERKERRAKRRLKAALVSTAGLSLALLAALAKIGELEGKIDELEDELRSAGGIGAGQFCNVRKPHPSLPRRDLECRSLSDLGRVKHIREA